jgi:hypothetical protein
MNARGRPQTFTPHTHSDTYAARVLRVRLDILKSRVNDRTDNIELFLFDCLALRLNP